MNYPGHFLSRENVDEEESISRKSSSSGSGMEEKKTEESQESEGEKQRKYTNFNEDSNFFYMTKGGTVQDFSIFKKDKEDGPMSENDQMYATKILVKILWYNRLDSSILEKFEFSILDKSSFLEKYGKFWLKASEKDLYFLELKRRNL